VSLLACLVPPLAVAVPAVLLDLLRRRDPRHAGGVAAGWFAALLPAVLVVLPWG
jgi:hypothetical protein